MHVTWPQSAYPGRGNKVWLVEHIKQWIPGNLGEKSMAQVAYKLNLKSHKLVRETIPVPEITDGQVLLQVYAAGLCASDVHLLLGALGVPHDNFVGGHEIAGKLVGVGKAVGSQYRVGDRFAVHISNKCGSCDMCEAGHNHLCDGNDSRGYGLGHDGGWQKYLAVTNLNSLVKIPDNVTYEVAAVLADAVITPYHAIKRCHLTPALKVLLIGAGGLGMNAIQIIRAYNPYLVVVDLKDLLKEKALELGANEFYTSAELRQLSIKPGSFDVTIDLCGFDDTYRLGVKYTKRRGTIAAVGLGHGRLSVNLAQLCEREIQLLCNFYGTVKELEEVLDLVSKGVVTPEIIRVPFDQLPQAVADLSRGKIKGRAVFNPSSGGKL